MSTIDDLACAKLAAAGFENPKAQLRDWKLFGPPEKDLSRYLRTKAWELEEAVAIGLGRHPHNLSISVIREKCPEQIDLQCKAAPDDLLPSAQLFMDRYELLKRAAFIDDIKSEERGGTLWFKPVDLAAYAQKEWDYMPPAARALMAATGLNADTEKKDTAVPVAAPTAAAVDIDTDKGKPGPSSLVGLKDKKGAPLKDKKGVVKTWEIMCSEMSKPHGERKFKTMEALQDHCQYKLGDDCIGYYDFQLLRKLANNDRSLIPYKPGAPIGSKRKSKHKSK